jgi:DNA polymerase III epsilon subunit-like protein
MIVLDIETSGLNPEEHGIWQIGAFEIENPNNYFIEEGRIDSEDKIGEGALLVTGKTKEDFLNINKQPQKELLKNFFEWCKNAGIKNCLCQNSQFDLGFVMLKARKYGLEIPLHHRAFDLHSIAQMKYYSINKRFLLKEDYSAMNLPSILEFCGMKDERRQVGKEGIVVEGKEHNALEDCKLTGECFSRIVFGNNLFEEFNKFEIPGYLKK